jgi:hypothetical protein
MSYALCFAEDFFWGDGSTPLEEIKPSARPTSVFQALVSMTDAAWEELAREVFHCEAEYLDVPTVIDHILSVNTCRNLDSPVEVSIDSDGWYTVHVYESRKEKHR